MLDLSPKPCLIRLQHGVFRFDEKPPHLVCDVALARQNGNRSDQPKEDGDLLLAHHMCNHMISL